jgi:Antitoxin VbhA
LRLSGLRPSAFAVALFERLVQGEITPDEVRAALEQHYRRD